MTFKIIIQQLPIATEFEVGSLGEAVSILQEQESQIRKLGEIAADLNDGGTAVATEAGGETAPAKRGRKPRSQPDPSTAQAPPPAPVPPAAAPPTAPVDTTPNANGLPAFLDRTGQAAAAPPPPPPPAPPAPPAAPPTGILAGKVIAELDRRKAGSVDSGKILVDWLVQAGLVQPGVSYEDATAALRMVSDERLATVAKALEVS